MNEHSEHGDRNDRNDNMAHTIGASVRPMAVGTLTAAPEHDDEELQILAARWAGGLYLIVAVISLLIAPKATSVGIIIDVALSIALLRGILKWRAFFIFRLVLSSLFAVVTGVAANSPEGVVEAGFTIALAAFLLLLVIGTPGAVRRRIGIAMGIVLVGLCALGAFL